MHSFFNIDTSIDMALFSRMLAQVPRLTYWIVAAIFFVMLLVLGASQTTYLALPGRATFSGFYHFIFYSFLTMVVWFSLRKPSVLIVVLMVGLAGCVDEIHQGYLAFRHANAMDWLIDVSAATVTSVILQYSKPIINLRRA